MTKSITVDRMDFAYERRCCPVIAGGEAWAEAWGTLALALSLAIGATRSLGTAQVGLQA